jgi:hypothetical protein
MFPKLNSVRSGVVKINGKKINIKPWSNRNVLYYEYAKDLIQDQINEEFITNIFEKKRMFMDAIFEHLVQPNIEYSGSLSMFEKEVLFIEMYKISRGPIVNITYECSCGMKSPNQFNIDKDYKITEVKPANILIGKFEFVVKTPSVVTDELPDIDEKDRLTYFYLSHIKEFKYNGELNVITDLKEFVNWALEELDETVFNELIDKVQKHLPTITLKTTVKCDSCGKTEEKSYRTFSSIYR